MKLLIVSPIFPPDIGGPATYISGLLAHLPNTVKVRVVGFGNPIQNSLREGGQAKFKIQNEKVKVHLIDVRLSAWRRQWELFKAVMSTLNWAEVVYVQGTLTVGLATMVACWFRRKPYVVKYVGDEGWEGYRRRGGLLGLEEYLLQIQNTKFKIQNWRPRLLFSLQKKILSNAWRVIVPGAYLQSILRKYYGVVAVDVPNAIGMKKSELRNKKKREKTLVYVGRLETWKHVDQIIKTVKLLKEEYKQSWQLKIVGSGIEEKKLKTLTKVLKLESQISFLSKQSKEKTLSLILNSSFLILYSSYEGLSHTLLEAMACKTPIITSDIPANRAVLDHGAYGKLVPLHQPDGLALAIIEPYDEAMIETAYRMVKSTYSWDNHVKQFMTILGKSL